MNRSFRLLLVPALLCVATSLFAAPLTLTQQWRKEFVIDPGGSFWLDNPFGNVEIIGTNGGPLVVSASKSVTSGHEELLRQGLEQTVIAVEGENPRVRIIRTDLSSKRSIHWSSSVSYSIQLPRSVHVRIVSSVSNRIRVINMAGSVNIKSGNGTVVLENVSGPAIVTSATGNVIYAPSDKVTGNVQIETVSGVIELRVPPPSRFDWIAKTIKGRFFTNYTLGGRFFGDSYRASLNGSGGPTLSTGTILGNIAVVRPGIKAPLIPLVPLEVRMELPEQTPGVPITMNTFQIPVIDGDWEYATNLGNVSIGQIAGKARIETGAGEIQVGLVGGECYLTSLGGPLDIGDVAGWLSAKTKAGHILVRTARQGGLLWTEGGAVRVTESGGALNLYSGGGDLIVENTTGQVAASTRSGDINLTLDPSVRSQRIEARTAQGNIMLTMNPQMSADIDASIVTADPDSNSIRSDFPGLAVTRKALSGNKTLIKMTGKVNGGGERIELRAEDGNIQILARSTVDLKSR